ncbi:hypothetical protein LTR97_005073 [Elasticomyces elasticus]|uniref:BTB domain-containing protein n=1 Tax=Elasticomyces elasticus TaxID=574655 RepID=A0AAN8A1P8_9PEZI|nr:hypothetical protein LTR97_005073 [Elasticomyces elasticus]
MSGEFSHLFGNEMFSDVVVKFGDREFPGHRMVLSQSLPYFKRLLEDKAVKTIRLEDNGQPDAIEALLRDLYGVFYTQNTGRENDWRFQLDVAAVAKQYQHSSLTSLAVADFLRVARKQMDIDTVKELLRALPRYRHLDCDIKKREDAIMERYSLELLNMPEFTQHFEGDPGTKLPDLLQDPEFAKRFDAQPGQAIAYLVQFGKAFRDLGAKLAEYRTIYPQHFHEITEQATKKPESLPVVQPPANVKEESLPTIAKPPAKVKEERQQPVKVKEEREQPLVKVKEEPKEAPSKKRKTQSVVRIEID